VRLTAPPAFVSETLIPSLRDFRKLYPELRLILSADTHVASLDSGDADLAIRLVEPTGQQNIVRRLGDISYALYATREYARRPPDEWQFHRFRRGIGAYTATDLAQQLRRRTPLFSACERLL
jgi:DNA-binding transcriptional LysR family regulator